MNCQSLESLEGCQIGQIDWSHMKDIERQCIGGLICYESNWFDMIWCSVVTSLLFFVVLQEPIRYAPGDPIEAF